MLPSILFAQVSAWEEEISVSFYNAPINEVISYFEKNYDINFSYSSNLVSLERNITYNNKEAILKRCVEDIFRQADIGYKIIGHQVVLKDSEPLAKIRIKEPISDKEIESKKDSVLVAGEDKSKKNTSIAENKHLNQEKDIEKEPENTITEQEDEDIGASEEEFMVFSKEISIEIKSDGIHNHSDSIAKAGLTEKTITQTKVYPGSGEASRKFKLRRFMKKLFGKQKEDDDGFSWSGSESLSDTTVIETTIIKALVDSSGKIVDTLSVTKKEKKRKARSPTLPEEEQDYLLKKWVSLGGGITFSYYEQDIAPHLRVNMIYLEPWVFSLQMETYFKELDVANSNQSNQLTRNDFRLTTMYLFKPYEDKKLYIYPQFGLNYIIQSKSMTTRRVINLGGGNTILEGSDDSYESNEFGVQVGIGSSYRVSFMEVFAEYNYLTFQNSSYFTGGILFRL